MITYNNVSIQRILNPTSIDLGKYVINPYMGCEYGCLYCYVRFNKVVSRRKDFWGTYVDIRGNAPELLLKELDKKQPDTVLLGSTTECFQPIEQKARLTRKILEILTEKNVHYVILTRSPYITEYRDILKAGYCKQIYFTFNTMSENAKKRLEPRTPSFAKRISAINLLISDGIPVIPYLSPVLPWISPIEHSFSLFPQATKMEFEGLNFRLGNITQIIKAITQEYPERYDEYIRLSQDKKFYTNFWAGIKKDIIKEAILTKKNYTVFIHGFDGYFENSYTK